MVTDCDDDNDCIAGSEGDGRTQNPQYCIIHYIYKHSQRGSTDAEPCGRRKA